MVTYSLRRGANTQTDRIDEDWGSLRWLASQKIGNAQGLVVGRVVIEKGKANPRHSHSNCEEVLYLLRGHLRHSIGDGTVLLEPGDVLVVGPGIAHNALNIGDDVADMIVAYSAGVRDFTLEK